MLGAGAWWLWRAGWPILQVTVLPLAAGFVLYVATDTTGRRWWRSNPWHAASRVVRQRWVPPSIAGMIVVLAGLVVYAPSWLVAKDTAAGTLTAEQRVNATSDARTALLQAVGGLLLATGAAATWRQVRISREGQVTERFTRAVDQLGSEHLDVRLGALYALERIAFDSPGDRRTIAEILTAYIRQRAPWPPTRPGQYRADWPLDQQPDLRTRAPDVQAALTVLGRGRFARLVSLGKASAAQLDLRKVDLRKAHLVSGNLQGAYLDGANLQGAHLDSANLQKALLIGANLQGARLLEANMQGALLIGANLQGTGLAFANLQGAWLAHGNLQGADLGCANLRQAHLDSANLQRAQLMGGNLQGALLIGVNLQGAELVGANLRGAQLVRANLQGARGSKSTVWPAGFSWQEAGAEFVDDVIDLGDLLAPLIQADQRSVANLSARPTEPELPE